jgi:hypothetical protein
MEAKEILKKLESVLTKISENKVSTWAEDLGDTFESVVDHDTPLSPVKYNGWREDLESLIDELKK